MTPPRYGIFFGFGLLIAAAYHVVQGTISESKELQFYFSYESQNDVFDFFL